MVRQRERVTFNRGSAALDSKVSAGLSHNRISAVHQSKTRPHTGVETLLDLQRIHGNAFVQRLVQHKLAVGRAGDRYGQEADRVADAPARKKGADSSMQAVSRQAELGVRPMCTECND